MKGGTSLENNQNISSYQSNNTKTDSSNIRNKSFGGKKFRHLSIPEADAHLENSNMIINPKGIISMPYIQDALPGTNTPSNHVDNNDELLLYIPKGKRSS